MNRRDVIISGGAAGLMSVSCGTVRAGGAGLFVPPEEAKHARTFMQWPVSRKIYSDPIFLKMVQQTIADIANAIAAFEPVTMLAAKEDHTGARALLSSPGHRQVVST